MARRAATFEKTIDLFIDNVSSPEFQKIHARIAKAALADHLAKVKSKPNVERFVDGREGLVEDQVKLYGVIRYEFHNLGDAVQSAIEFLVREGAKVGPEFANSFFVGILRSDSGKVRGKEVTTHRADGRMVPAKDFGTKNLPADAEYLIGNRLSYNRKVDVQQIGKKPMKFDVDPFLYARCAQMLNRRYRSVKVKSVYNLTFDGQYILKTGPKAGRPVHSPGIIITRRE